MCLPDSAAKEIVEAIGDSKTKILDTSTAHRTNPAWAYGFPELSDGHRESIIKSKRTAVPGCHASGFISLVYPLVEGGILPKDYPVASNSLTGYSGGGKKMIAEYEAEVRPEEFKSPRQYGLTQMHKHLPEMTKVCSLEFEPCFSPIVGDFYSGMTVTVPLFKRLLSKKVNLKDIYEVFCKHYENKGVVKVMPFGTEGFLGTNNLKFNDGMEIFVSGNDERILLASRFDNLGKGSSGAAVQCLNLMLGTEETKGLIL